MIRGLLSSGYVRAVVYVLANHCVFYGSELAYQRFCVPARGFWHSLFTNGSAPCAYLRSVSTMSGNLAYTLACTGSFVMGSYANTIVQRCAARAAPAVKELR